VIERRSFARGAALVWLLARLPAAAQPANRLPRVARIAVDAPLAEILGADPINANARGFAHGLRDLRRVDDRDLIIEHRSAEGRPERVPALVREVFGLGMSGIAVDGSEDFESAFASMSRQRPDAIVATDTPLNIGNRARIVECAARERLPATYGLGSFPRPAL
jgi:hypothetical protein